MREGALLSKRNSPAGQDAGCVRHADRHAIGFHHLRGVRRHEENYGQSRDDKIQRKHDAPDLTLAMGAVA